ncbi:MAG TPA: DUF4167 domain-containing protein [Caulobacteraceae bacterium]
MKRQRGRNRNGGGGSGGGGRPQHNTNRAFDSNGPDGVKVRGAAQHVYEKYQQLARDAHTAGDRVVAENYLQHAEHYFRVMRAMQPQRPLSEIVGRDQFVSGFDIDFEDENGAGENAGAESDGETRENGADRTERFEQRRDERPRDDYRQADQRPRDDRGSAERPQNDRPQSQRPSGEPQASRFADERAGRANRDDRPHYNRDERAPRFDRDDRPDRDSLNAVEPQPSPVVATQPVQAETRVLRADDGEVNNAPAFLQVRPVEARAPAAGDAGARRRRPPRTVEAPVAGTAPPETEEA